MREIPYRDPVPGATSNGLSSTGLSLEPPAFTPVADELGLTLARDPAEPAPRRRKPLPRRPLILVGWAIMLGAALSVAYISQPTRQLTGDTDLPPAVAPAAADELGAPVTAPSIASSPERFVQAASAPEINPAAPPDDPQPGELKIAEAAPNSAVPDTKAGPAPATPTAPVTDTIADAPKPAAKLEKVAAKPKPAEADTTEVRRRKVETVDKEPDRPRAEGANDLALLKARLNHAYAAAVKAGTPKTVLKARQAEWQVLRAKAEKKGPAAVAALYRTRAAQLEAIVKKTTRNRGKA